MFMNELFDQEAIDGLCDFLGIGRHAADFTPVHEGRALELPDDLRDRMREGLDDTYAFVAERFAERKPEGWLWTL
jgi:hypothetical protein